MSVQGENRDSIRRYLLGDVSEEERERLERRLIAEDDLYQQMLMAEDDLIDEYVSGALPEQDGAKFSRHFLQAPELRQDVRFAVALRQRALKSAPLVASKGEPKGARPTLLHLFVELFTQPAFGVAVAAALLAVVLLAAWFAMQNSQLRRQVEQLQARATPSPSPPNCGVRKRR